MTSREEMAEVYGEEFADEMEQEFDIAPEDMNVPFSYRVKQRLYFAIETLKGLLEKNLVWYVAGLVDGLIVALVVYFLK